MDNHLIITKLFKDLCKLEGKRVAVNNEDVGAWHLSYMPNFGGYRIEEPYFENNDANNLANCYPIGNRRYSAVLFSEIIASLSSESGKEEKDKRRRKVVKKENKGSKERIKRKREY
jgi:hypothetical protein